MKPIIAPSMLSADFGHLCDDVQMVNESEADWFHLDIMDGVFVPNISYGFPVIKYIKKFAKKPLDIHLMIVQPERYIGRFKEYGADLLSVHYEACTHLNRTIQLIKSEGMKAGVVLNPHTHVTLLEDIIDSLDYVLIMSVNPGYGGQQFIENTYNKIKKLKNLIIDHNASTIIEIDGGVTFENAPKLVKAGADALVAGNTVFGNPNPVQAISVLKNLTTPE